MPVNYIPQLTCSLCTRYRYILMSETIDEAFQTLYWTYREGADFPGVLPGENQGLASTWDILARLGSS
jgi:hypothetical protein